MSRLPSIILAAAVAMFAAQVQMPVQATTLLQLEGQGYQVVRHMTIAGQFNGCQAHQVVDLADGSSFICDENRRAVLANPQVLLLRALPEGTYVLFIANHAYTGSLLQLGDDKLGTPIQLEAISDAPPQTPTGEPEGDRIDVDDPTESIDVLRVRDRLQLETAQRYSIDHAAARPHAP